MKISKLVKQLKEIEKVHGDINIVFDAASVEGLIDEDTGEIDEDSSIVDIEIFGVHDLYTTDLYTKEKTIVLIMGEGEDYV